MVAGLVLVAAALLLYAGWRAHWFLTDDAYIAFRFVSNRQHGWGYTWNPPPFRPVEGYSSFGWVVLLDLLWTLFGVEPPQIANDVALAMSLGTLGLCAWATRELARHHGAASGWVWLLAAVLAATVSQRSFLVWSSSGLETALFNLTLQAWTLSGLYAPLTTPPRAARWLTVQCALAGAVALVRPDGLLLVAASAPLAMSIVALRVVPLRRALACCAPLSVVAAHLAFRLWTYGELLPNTYYAKVVHAWPEAGVRYAASFALEYAYVLAWPLWLAGLLASARRPLPTPESGRDRSAAVAQRWVRGIVIATLLAKLGFDLLIAGGDHFEYRSLSYLVPLLALAFLHGALSLLGAQRARLAALALLVWAGVSAILPWTHYARSAGRDSWPASPQVLALADAVPAPLRPMAATFDALQAWLIRHGVCVRHYEHRAFWLHQLRSYPSRDVGARACSSSENPVAPITTIGVAGWVLSGCHVIDLRGLTDHVIARAPVAGDRPSYLAHDRRPPLEYLQSFLPNVFVRDGRVAVYPRPAPLRDADIRRIEDEYWK